MDNPNPQQMKSQLVVTNKESLKELESGGLRGKLMEKYEVVLPTELEHNHNTGGFMPNPQIMNQLAQKFPNAPSSDIMTATLLVQGTFGDKGRVVGLSPELAKETEWMMMERDRENGIQRRALS